MDSIKLLLIVCSLIQIGSSNNQTGNDNQLSSIDFIQWPKLFKDSWFGSRFTVYNERFNHVINSTGNISQACYNSLKIYFENPFDHEWSMKMWDSNGHFPSGILSGTFFEPGNFDQCLSLTNADGSTGLGKYCILEIRLPVSSSWVQNETLSMEHEQWGMAMKYLNKWNHYSGIDNGLCLPSQCSDQEINHIVPKVLIPSEWNLQVRTKLCQQRSTQLNHQPLRFGQKVVLSILMIHIGLVMIGTITSSLLNAKSSTIIKFLNCFSWTKNTRALFHIDNSINNKNETSLKFIHGLRVFSIYWILMAHVILFYPFLNLEDRVSPVESISHNRASLIKNLLTHFIVNAGLAVETFFLISGALTVYTALSSSSSSPSTTDQNQHNNNARSMNFIIYVILRWFRFAPATLGAMSILILWPNIASGGPLFHSKFINFLTEPCYHNWWISFTFLANWFPSAQVCNVMHWYLSADFQLHILLYVVIYIYRKRCNRMINYSYITFMMIAGFMAPIAIVLMRWASAPNPSIFLHPTHQFPMDKVEIFIFHTYNHLIPYFIGACFGFMLIRSDHSKPISKFRRFVIWIIIFPLFMALPFGSYTFVDSPAPVDEPLQSAITFGIIRLIWSLGIYWISYECYHRRCGWIGSFLETGFFQPLSRLSFSIYLVHIIPIWHYMFTIRQPIHLSLYNLLLIGMGNAVCSTILSYLLYCLFERPYSNMIKTFLFNNNHDYRKRSSSPTNNNDQQHKSI